MKSTQEEITYLSLIKSLIIFALFFFPFNLLTGQINNKLLAETKIDSLIQISRDFTAKKDFEKALELNASAEEIALKNLKKESAAYASICFNHGRVLHLSGDYENAEQFYLESKVIREKILGKNHLDYVGSLNNLSILYKSLNKFAESEKMFLEMIDIRGVLLGKDNPKYALSIFSLANLYFDFGKYEKAEIRYLEALNIRKQILGENHLDYAASLYGLAICYKNLGYYEKAEPLLLKTKSIEEKILGNDDPDFALTLNSLANLYSQMGDYEKAEPLYLRAITITEKASGTDDLYYAACLNNLGNLYFNLFNYEKTEQLYLEAISIIENKLGKDNLDYANGLINLGNYYYAISNIEKAKLLYLEALGIQENILGIDNFDYALNNYNLGNLYHSNKEYEIAEKYYNKSKEIFEKTVGKNHPLYAVSLINYGNLFFETGQFDKAESSFFEAKTIFESALGIKHNKYPDCLVSIAKLLTKKGDYDKARGFYVKAAELKKESLVRASTHLSETELSAYTQDFSGIQNQLLSVAQTQNNLTGDSYDNALFYKDFLLNNIGQIKRMAFKDSMNTEIYLRLKSYQRRIAAEYAKPISQRNDLTELERQANQVEKELTRRVTNYGPTIRLVGWQEVQATLKPNEVSIEFIHYQYFNPESTDSILYAALVLRPNDEKPQFVPLFTEKRLSVLLKKTGAGRAEFVNNLYYHNSEVLYNLIWQPLEKVVGEGQTIYYSPSGLMHLINLGALPTGKKEFELLANRHQLRRLNSTRELVMEKGLHSNNFTAALFGGIQYEADFIAENENNFELRNNEFGTRSSLGYSLLDSTLRSGTPWEYLESTKEEIEAIEVILQKSNFSIVTKNNQAATEESFKTLSKTTNKPSPNIIHVATHGYFFPNPTEKIVKVVDNNLPIFKIAEHPMIRSGLLFAGSNYAWKNGKSFAPNRDDGILTAYEISQMDLSDTELVVLSACETGLGDIKGNEGVYGLQRAFKIAGVKNIMMSLWQVPDYHTKELMIRFYENWLDQKMEIHAALRDAQKTMMEEGYEPFQWAGFVLLE